MIIALFFRNDFKPECFKYVISISIIILLQYIVLIQLCIWAGFKI